MVSQVWIDSLGVTGLPGLDGFSQCQGPYQKGWTLLLPGSLTRGLYLLWCHPAAPQLLAILPPASQTLLLLPLHLRLPDRRQPTPLFGVRCPPPPPPLIPLSDSGAGDSLRRCPPLHKLAGSQVTGRLTRNIAANWHANIVSQIGFL